MPLQCNIDARGKLLRLIYGLILLAAGVVLALFWPLRDGSALGWVVVAVMILMGAFGVFEARAGWCVMRAMGFKTRY